MKKGFTLIELLAVIVILAIIALIATPIILGIISDTREVSKLRSAELYTAGIEQAIVRAKLNDKEIKNGTYKITQSGDICLKYDINNNCIDLLKVEVDGEKPTEGSKVTIKKGQIQDIKFTYEDKKVIKDETGNYVYKDESIEFEPVYEIGEEVTFNPGDQDRTWNVVDEDEDTVTLMLTENLGDTVVWYNYSNQNSYDNSYGPKDALEYLNSLTTTWDNVDPIESYTYVNNLDGTQYPNGYQKIEITNGYTKLTHKDGETVTILNEEYEAKARILSREEVFEISKKINSNFEEENLRAYILRNLPTLNAMGGTNLTTVDEAIAYAIQMEGNEWIANESKYIQTYYVVLGMTIQYQIEPEYNVLLPQFLYQNLYTETNNTLPYGYWTFSSDAEGSEVAWNVRCDGTLYDYDVDYGDYYGVRPVITILKSNL